MKTRIVLTAIITGLLPLAAFSQNTAGTPSQPAVVPAPPAPPAPVVPPQPPADAETAKEPVTFLGVETSRVPRVLSEQMNLPRGFGVVVDYVAPKSPAAAAGLQQSDIIRMLNDQILINPDQLGALVRNFPNGATINLTVLRKGQELKLPIKLEQKMERIGRGPIGYEWNFNGLDRLTNLRMPDMSAVNEAVERAKKEALRAGDEARENARRLRIVTTDDEGIKSTHVDLGKAQIVLSDDKGELRLENVDGKKMLTAKDRAGQVIFRGPIDTQEERAKLPQEVQKRLESLEHQDLPPVPPNEQVAPRPPDPNQSAEQKNTQFQQAALSTPNNRTGWVRDTSLL